MEFAKEWSKNTAYLIEVGECEREDKYAGHDVSKLGIKTQPSNWKALGYARSKLEGSYMARKDDKDDSRILIRVTLFKDGKTALYSEVLDPFKERCEALLNNAKNGLMNFHDRIGRYYSDEGKEALQEAIREVCRKATDYEDATVRSVFQEIQGDGKALDLFWKALNDDASRN
jgi:hypothetical protein